ncbi:MAG: DUF503 domain-containing protein [Planctomycetes bacterium]|nr:DUF503 domain-containing protein [Planctomycetota bacterium]
MRIGWLRADLHLHMAHSLKEKRRPLKALMERIRHRFHVSVAEVDCQDRHQRAVIGIAVVAADGGSLAAQMRAVREFIEHNPECQVIAIDGDSLGWRDE